MSFELKLLATKYKEASLDLVFVCLLPRLDFFCELVFDSLVQAGLHVSVKSYKSDLVFVHGKTLAELEDKPYRKPQAKHKVGPLVEHQGKAQAKPQT